jgi:hypothetical protein
VTPEAYRAVRADERQFIVAPGHEIPDVEAVVAKHEGFFVIEKPTGVDHITTQ